MSSGVVQAHRGRHAQLSFICPAFRDYLAASELADQIKGSKPPGWGKMPDLPCGEEAAWKLVNENSGAPIWQDTVTFLAGQLPVAQALALVSQLANPGNTGTTESDAARNARLLLAACCMNEIAIP